MDAHDLSGQVLGQYELQELLGRGGMGAVYRAYQRALKRAVAVKVLPAALATDPDYIARFTREAETAASLEHPHIIPIYDYGVEGGTSYIVMRLLTGGTLADRMTQRQVTGRPLPSLSEIARLLAQVADAFDYAHRQGVIHRDVKPSNIMFDAHGNAFLVDFGIAKLLEHTSALTATGAVIGTPLYMAPEQWRAEPPTPATDQYALGVTIFQLLTGQVPFQAPTPYGLMHKHLNEPPPPPHLLRPGLPPALAATLTQAMAKSPADRFPTVTAFAQAFAQASAGQPDDGETQFFTAPLELRPTPERFVPVSTPSQPPSPPPSTPGRTPTAPRPAGEPPSRGRASLVWGALVLLMAVVIGAGALILRGGAKETPSGDEPPSPTAIAAPPSQTPTVAGGLIVLATETPTFAVSPSLAAVTAIPSQTSTVAGGLIVLATETPTFTVSPSPAAVTAIPSQTSTVAGGLVLLVTGTQVSPEPLASATPSPTVTDTATPSPSPSPTSSATATPTDTPSPRPTDTPTPDIAGTTAALVAERLTQTAAAWTDTPTPNLAATVEALAIAALTATAEAWTDTPTPSPTPTSTLTPTATVTPSDTPTFTVTPSPEPSFTPGPPIRFPPPPQATLIPAGSPNRAWTPLVSSYKSMAFVAVPPGCFLMGSEEGDVDEKPVRRVCLSAYWIGQTEVTNAQYAACVTAGACAPPRDRTAFDDPAQANLPVTWVSWFDAAAFAEWMGATLPTGAQWEYAARGPESWVYPWGNTPPDCTLANLTGCAGDVQPVGSYPAGASWVGALDMTGNVWEWVAEYYGRDYYASLADGVLDPTGPPYGDMHNVRGGSWHDEVSYARAFYQGGNYPDYAIGVLGFRVALPASAAGEQPPSPTPPVPLSITPFSPSPTPFLPPTATPFGGGMGEIAFVSERDGNREIYVMDVQTGLARRLTANDANDRDPAWSPESGRIAFYSDRDGNNDIYVMDADGGNVRNLTRHPANEYHPTWSPDGTRIAFSSDRDGTGEIYVMNDDGSNVQRLTGPGSNSGNPAWSPDGTRIAFSSSRSGDEEIYVMNADGSQVVRLTFSPGHDGFPAWSPDGTRIAFQSNRDGQFEVYVVNADGSGERRLTTTPSNDWWPEWSADGTQIAFISDRDGVGAIYVMLADGSNPLRVTPRDSWNDSPSWRPAPGLAARGVPPPAR